MKYGNKRVRKTPVEIREFLKFVCIMLAFLAFLVLGEWISIALVGVSQIRGLS